MTYFLGFLGRSIHCFFEIQYHIIATSLSFPFRNIQAFNMALMGNKALFQIDVILSAPNIVLQPQSSEIYWLIMQCIRDCVESTKVESS